MKHLLSICSLLFIASPFLNALPFSKILLKPEYQIQTTLDAPFSLIIMGDEILNEYTFISEKEVICRYLGTEISGSHDRDNATVTMDYTTDFNEEDFNFQYNEYGDYEFKMTISFWEEYVITMDKDKGLCFTTSYEYPESWGDYSREEITVIEVGLIEVLE